MTYFTKSELIRAAELLKETDPRSSEYHVLLRSIEYLDSMGQTLDEIAGLDPNEDSAETESARESEDTGAIKAPSNVVPFTAAEYPVATEDEPPEDPPQTVAPPESSAPPAEEKTYTSAQVRKALVDARSKGTDVKALLAEVGADNFQAVPASKYGTIMKKLGVIE